MSSKEDKLASGIKLLAIADVHMGKFRSEAAGQEFKRVVRRYAWDVDHVLFAGDFTNDAKDSEYEICSKEIDKLPPERVSLIPGNHDVISMGVVVFGQKKRDVNRERFIDRFDRFLPPLARVCAPYMKIDGDIAVICVDTIPDFSMNNPWTTVQSVGIVGGAQRERLEKMLHSPKLQDKFIVVMMHHDPYDKRRKDPTPFLDKLAVRKVLESSKHKGRGIILLCGHNHNLRAERISDRLLHFQAPSVFKGAVSNGPTHLVVHIAEDFSFKIISL